MTRFWEIDFLRGIAIVMMVWFHFLWDLNYFNIMPISLYVGFWGYFQKITAGLFLFLVGVVLTLNYNRHKEKYAKKFLKRGTMIFGGGLIITIATIFLFPNNFVYFGILHIIGVAIILSIPLVSKKNLNLLLAAIVFMLPMLFDLRVLEIPLLVWLGFATPTASIDFFPMFPWFSMILFGLFIGNEFYEKGVAKTTFEKPKTRAIPFLELLGKHSLLIYFLHQPVLFALIFTVTSIM